MAKVAPSILSADFSALLDDVRKIEQGGGDYIHVDVMDGHFVPNISYGAPVLKCLNGKTDLPYDVHLMIENPDNYIEDFVMPNTEFIVVHQEACIHLDRTIDYIKSFGVKAGVSLNPSTPPETLDYVIDKLDMVLVMSVNPGFASQKFILSAVDKIQILNEIRIDNDLNYLIEVDGGVSEKNARDLVDSGADILVAGSAVFSAPDPVSAIKKLKEI
jgi:ribulose-phosphate 3-epimerase